MRLTSVMNFSFKTSAFSDPCIEIDSCSDRDKSITEFVSQYNRQTKKQSIG
jgi:hypothetical protein